MSCYRLANSTTTTDTSVVDAPCFVLSDTDSIAPCCPLRGILGTGNLCLNDFLCWESEPPPGGSGYLTSSCTDETYQSGQCTRHCVDQAVPDVIYNFTTGLWHCCGSNEEGISCSTPTDETFEAPAPQILTSSARAALTGTSTSITASTSASSSSGLSNASTSSLQYSSYTIATSTVTATIPSQTSVTPPNTPIADSSSGLSTGAKAGIGVGVGIGAVSIISLILWLLFSRSKHHQGAAAGSVYSTRKSELSAEPSKVLGPIEKRRPELSAEKTMNRAATLEQQQQQVAELPSPSREFGRRSEMP